LTAVSRKGEWIANCMPDRVARISSASVYLLQVGPPRPNQMQRQEDLENQGMVGLYRMGEKSAEETQADQTAYLEESEFAPAPGILRVFFDTAAGGAS
jgi:hypothetical protein